MYATISKRFEFSASHRARRDDWSDAQNAEMYATESCGSHGHGHNYVAYFAFHGPIDPTTGMILNISTIKEKVKLLLDSRYDHKFLNKDTPPFHRTPATVENIARELWREAESLFVDEPAKLVACHLQESRDTSATAYADGTVEKHLHFSFSAARRTWSPKLSESENASLFGSAASPEGHGHLYRVRLTLGGNVEEKVGTHLPYSTVNNTITQLREQLDHTNLTAHLPEFKTEPNTTESLAAILFQRLRPLLPVIRVKVYEHDDFFVEHVHGSHYTMGVTNRFFASHRLNAETLSAAENRELYGKCNNPGGHGHEYVVECAIDGSLDTKSGTLYPLPKLEKMLDDAVSEWRCKHLDLEVPYFSNRTSTGENILSGLWNMMQEKLGRAPFRMRLWETPNNRFTLRRELPR